MTLVTLLSLHTAAAGLFAQAVASQPQRSPLSEIHNQLENAANEAYAKFKGNTEGKNADYIPALAQVDPRLFGIATVTTDGLATTAGDVNYTFSIQSISKVFTLALAMEEQGADAVFEKIGNEPTGRPFNSLTALAEMPGHTANPFVNAGAIATTSLITGPDADAKWNKILSFYNKVSGARLSLMDDVYKSEAATNMGNRGIAMLLANWKRIYSDPLEATDIYTKQCSVGVNAKQLAMMGATLANNGKHPLTGVQVIRPENIPHILASMMTAGLYDGSGAWAWQVGIPAKSGVGGGILAIVPGKGAIVGFAPPLDPMGNSVRAQKAISYIAHRVHVDVFSPQ